MEVTVRLDHALATVLQPLGAQQVMWIHVRRQKLSCATASSAFYSPAVTTLLGTFSAVPVVRAWTVRRFLAKQPRAKLDRPSLIHVPALTHVYDVLRQQGHFSIKFHYNNSLLRNQLTQVARDNFSLQCFFVKALLHSKHGTSK